MTVVVEGLKAGVGIRKYWIWKKFFIAMVLWVFMYFLYYIQTGQLGSYLIGQADVALLMVFAKVPFVGGILVAFFTFVFAILDLFLLYVIIGMVTWICTGVLDLGRWFKGLTWKEFILVMGIIIAILAIAGFYVGSA